MTTDLTAKPMCSAHNIPLQAGYAAWANALPADARVVISLTDSAHAMAAFFGILATGRICGIGNAEIAKNLCGEFVVLDHTKPPSDTPFPNHTASHFITFSGGTTHTPKAILRHVDSWIYSFHRQGIHAHNHVGILGALSHSLACYAATESAYLGAKTSYLSPRTNLADHKIDVIYATPTQIKILCKSHAVYPALTSIFIGGGALDEHTQKNIAQVFPNANLRIFYGAAETSFISISDATTPNGSVGKPYDGVDIQIRNGGVFVKSAMNADRYLCPDKTIAGDDGYVDVGELGYFDDAGHLYITGRRDRAVNIADQLVHLDDIERIILVHDGVEFAAVISVDDSLRGNQLACAIKGKADLSSIKHLSKRRIFTVEDWPMLPSGKTDYRTITQYIKDRLE